MPTDTKGTRIILGIDPGIHGACALLDLHTRELLDAWDLPTLTMGKRPEIDVSALMLSIDQITQPNNTAAIIEEVHAMPKQGVTSSYRFGYACGIIRGVLMSHGMPLQTVTPQRWKRDILHGRPKEKDASRAFAAAFWPRQAQLFSRRKDHQRADAACIALWGAMRSAHNEHPATATVSPKRET